MRSFALLCGFVCVITLSLESTASAQNASPVLTAGRVKRTNKICTHALKKFAKLSSRLENGLPVSDEHFMKAAEQLALCGQSALNLSEESGAAIKALVAHDAQAAAAASTPLMPLFTPTSAQQATVFVPTIAAPTSTATMRVIVPTLVPPTSTPIVPFIQPSLPPMSTPTMMPTIFMPTMAPTSTPMVPAFPSIAAFTPTPVGTATISILPTISVTSGTGTDGGGVGGLT